MLHQIPGPIQQYTLGKSPTYAEIKNLHESYDGFSRGTMLSLLVSLGLITDKPYKPTAKALDERYLVGCQRKLLWDINKLMSLLQANGIKVKRRYANQKIKANYVGEQFSKLEEIAPAFNVSAKKVGEWLSQIGVRDSKGLPTKKAQSVGLGIVNDVIINKKTKKTVKSAAWEYKKTVRLLMRHGHPLDFDCQASLKGKGKNSDVQVAGADMMEKRAHDFLKEFVPRYKAHDITLKKLVWETPTPILVRAERILGKEEGFFKKGVYEKNLFSTEKVDYSREGFSEKVFI